MEKKYALEERLVTYKCRMIYVVEALPGTRAGNYIAGQLFIRVIPQLLIMERRRQRSQEKISFINWVSF